MSQKHGHGNASTLINALVLDGTNTDRKALFTAAKGSGFALHIEWTAPTGFTGSLQLWGSNKPTPDVDTDADWKQLGANHGYDGLPDGDPTTIGAAASDMVILGNSTCLWYRVVATRSAGDCTVTVNLCQKDDK